MKLRYSIALVITLFAGIASHAHASQLSYVSDTITDSRLGTPADHTIVFKVPTAVPASGHIVITFEGLPFIIDPSFDASDMTLAVSHTSPSSGFVDRALANTADALDDGAAVTSPAGPINITLSSGAGIAVNSYVRLVLGGEAITNPTTTASYRIFIDTFDPAHAPLDYGAAMVAILPAIAVSADTDKVNPAVITNGMPSGTIPSNVSGVLVSFNTDTFATCRYSTVASTTYDAMTNSIVHNGAGTLHTFSVTGIAKGTNYTFYVRCVDFAGNKNPSDYIISFTAGDPTGTGLGGGVGTGQVAASSGSGSGGGGGGGGEPYPASPQLPSLEIRGVGLPNSQVSLLRDGVVQPGTASVDNMGNFSFSIPSLPQGSYTFTLFINDNNGKRITSKTVTLTVVAGTTNSITGVVLPPSISVATSTVNPGDKVTITGISEPSSTVEIWTTSQQELQDVVKATVTAGAEGLWTYTLNTAKFPVDTYQIKARSSVPGLQVSGFDDPAYLGVGVTPSPKAGTDLNGDGKVNLVDFSILLAHWGKPYPPADFNADGAVNLIDFSILLSHWTG